MYQYIHTPGCGKPAFLYDHMPDAGDVIRVKHMRHVGGRVMDKEGPRRCGSCGDHWCVSFKRENLKPL